MADVTFNMKENSISVHQSNTEPWSVTLVDTGENTMTGGRLKRVFEYIKDEESFCFTYGDGVGDINIRELLAFHKSHGKLATLTSTRPPGRYGALMFAENGISNQIISFKEKPEGEESWINGGFFVLSPEVVNRIKDDETSWEAEPLMSLATDGELCAFKHSGFW